MKSPIRVAVVGMAAIGVLACAGCARDNSAAIDPNLPAVNAAAAGRFADAGREASMKVLPTSLAGTSSREVGEVVAIMLERGGMTELRVAEAIITPPKDADISSTTGWLAEYVRSNPSETEFTLFTEFLGSPASGISEVRMIVVNQEGSVAWIDRQHKGVREFDRIKPREPLEACVLVERRLGSVLGLGNPAREGASAGRIEQARDARTGIPGEAERRLIEERGKAFRASSTASTMTVYPIQVGERSSVESAEAIAEMINAKGLFRAHVAAEAPPLARHGGMNQQRALWSLANGFSGFIRHHPPQSDYALGADYLIGPSGVGGVHTVVCDKEGNLVAVDLQNSHWPDFNSVKPKSSEDCNRLVVRRLGGLRK